MFAKPLTQNTWLLTSELGHHISIVWRREDVFVSTHNNERVYQNLKQISDEFAETLVEKINDKEVSTYEVLGYPTKHDAAYEITEGKFPTYKSKEGSTVVFAAGWWVLHYNGAYRVGLSPKVSTLDDLCVGPHKDKFSANVTLNTVNKRKMSDERLIELTESPEENDD
jgi:hypothetical protein